MSIAVACEPPESSLLRALRRGGSFADCYTTQLPIAVTQAQFVEAFYTTPLFKAERLVLKVFAASPSTDQDARDLAQRKKDTFAIWRVAESRTEQLLLTDRTGRTSSWLMARPDRAISGEATSLFFGSAVTARTNANTGRQEFGPVFRVLLPLHGLYARRLLEAAASRLMSSR